MRLIASLPFALHFIFCTSGDSDKIEHYEKGLSLEENGLYDEAQVWFSKSANAGHGEAMYRLGRLYTDGRVVGSPNRAVAAEYFRKAFDAGVAAANPELWYKTVRGVRCRHGVHTFPVDHRPSRDKDIFSSLESYDVWRRSSDAYTSAMLWSAMLWCDAHWSCYGFSYYSNDGPNAGLHVGYGHRPQFCAAPFEVDTEFVEEDGWMLVLRMDQSSDGVLKRQLAPPQPDPVPRCSYAGELTRCFQPQECQHYDFKPGKRAFVLSHDLATPFKLNVAYLRWIITLATRSDIDVAYIFPKKSIAPNPLEEEARSLLASLGVRIVEVDWVLPELSDHINKYTKTSWCLSRDFFKFHALGLEEYDAVVLYDSDVLPFKQEVEQLFECAFQGFFVASASHGGFEPVNAAFFAVRPQRKLLLAILRYLRQYATYNNHHGWNGLGFGPWNCVSFDPHSCFNTVHVGGECSQGLFYSLFYTANRGFQNALREEGAMAPLGVTVDGCVWAHENTYSLRGYFPAPYPCSDLKDCSAIVAFHGAQLPDGCASDDAVPVEVNEALLREEKAVHEAWEEPLPLT